MKIENYSLNLSRLKSRRDVRGDAEGKRSPVKKAAPPQIYSSAAGLQYFGMKLFHIDNLIFAVSEADLFGMSQTCLILRIRICIVKVVVVVAEVGAAHLFG